MRTFGCLAYYRNIETKGDKFAPRAKIGVFVGYPFGVKGYKVYDLEKGKILNSKDIKVIENSFPFLSKHKDVTEEDKIIMEEFWAHHDIDPNNTNTDGNSEASNNNSPPTETDPIQNEDGPDNSEEGRTSSSLDQTQEGNRTNLDALIAFPTSASFATAIAMADGNCLRGSLRRRDSKRKEIIPLHFREKRCSIVSENTIDKDFFFFFFPEETKAPSPQEMVACLKSRAHVLEAVDI
ncbi:hypothetical protein E3N88_07309 [Mikania micrantha]|uniref:Retroviral polymerase SH3-like domain-containing protein n=1 Tax=Mikania micrantha TaxID=192012 RepID=A0A5N6PR74_9ASTR|nr:hypothetical protein E3N88_07309 [Mikania micrantha]